MSKKKSTKRSGRSQDSSGGSGAAALDFSRVNLVLALAGIASLVAGYWLLAQGSITAAPLLLVLGYVVLLPLAIIL